MELNIHQPKDNTTQKVTMENVKPHVTYYGKKTTSTIEKDSYAYKQVDGKNTRFYCYASRDGHFYNPWQQDGRNIYQWTQVQEKVFNSYVTFLNTNKEAFLSLAEKENIYG